MVDNKENPTPTEEQMEEDIGLQDKYLDSNWEESVQKFEELNLNKDLLRGIYGYGFVIFI